MAQAEAQIAAAPADAERADARLDAPAAACQVGLRQQGSLDNAKADRDRAAAAVKSAEAALAAAAGQCRGPQAPAGEARARRGENSRPRSTKAERDLSFTVIRAPFDGVIGNKAVQVGDYVQPGPRLAALVPLDQRLCRRQFQGDAARRAAARARRSTSRSTRLPEHDDRRHGRELRAGLRLGVLAAAARQRDRQLHQDRAARAGAHHRRRPTSRARVCCAPACRSSSASTPSRDRVAGTAAARDAGRAVRSAKEPAELHRHGQPPPSRIAPAGAVDAPAPARPAPRRRLHLPWCSACSWRSWTSRSSRPRSPRSRPACRPRADEISWVQTSYLIAEVIMIPLSGFLSRVLVDARACSRSRPAGFTLMSLMCAHRHRRSSEMIVWRALQGFIGGGMIPTVFASAFTIFPREKQPMISPIIGLVATLAPTIGPTVGGYLTDVFSWHWLFLVNIVPGIVVTIAAWTADRFRRARLFAVQATSTGRASLFMAVFLGALEYVLEEGPRTTGSTTARSRRPRRGLAPRRRGRVLLARAHRAGSRSSTCAPSPTAISRRLASSASCSASGFTA